MKHQSLSWLVLFLWKEGGLLYPVSEAFLQVVQENTRRYHWTGKITTKKGVIYEFGADDIVKGSGYISSQCFGSTEIELGTVYAAEMGITLFSDIDRYTLEDALVELFYHLKLADGIFEEVPMGIFEVSEANRNIKTFNGQDGSLSSCKCRVQVSQGSLMGRSHSGNCSGSTLRFGRLKANVHWTL